VPFDGKDSNLLMWQRIIEQCKEWNPRIITFGGGDPFFYKDFYLLLKSTMDNRVFIQVDTNGLGLKISHLPIIKQTVQLLGLPIDGTEEVHGRVRGHASHFNIVLNWLQRFSDEGVPIKINTVVTKLNIHDLDNIAQILIKFPIRTWSLYQFWPLGFGKYQQEQLNVSKQEFLDATRLISDKYNFTKIEVSPISNRLLGYFFVAHTGRVYVMDKHNPEEYVELGSIFDKDILLKWQKHGDYDALNSRATLRTNP
jgi:MoaA/NifB/PqqE/SkfB family radical SAM enzyme